MRRHTIHVVGQAHIDVAWFWPYDPETIHDCCRFTFLKAIDNLERHKEYVFAQSQALLYQAVEEHFPELFAKIVKYVREGRWDAVGGMHVEPECAEPCGEALVRQCIFGQQYFHDKLGAKVKVAWLPDTWTYPWQLPQILKKSGLEYLLFSRWGDEKERLLWWEAPDGSRVLAYYITYGGFHFRHRPFPDLRELASDIGGRYGVENIMVLIGGGDHGGGPTYQEIANIKEIAGILKPEIEVQFSRPSQFFEQLAEEVHELPVLNDELGFELGGSLTTCSEVKRGNRLSENLLLTAEKSSLVAATLTDLAYPKEELDKAWRKVLFNQFHDTVGGCIVPSAQRYTKNMHDEVVQASEDLLEKSFKAVSSLVDTENDGVNIVVFNVLSWDRTDLVEVELEIPKEWKALKLLDPEGKTISTQTLEWKKEEDEARTRFVFEAESVPSMGYRTYRIVPSDEPSHPTQIEATREGMENDFFRIRLSSDTGCIGSLLDKANDREIMDESGRGNLLQLIEDMGDSEGFLVKARDIQVVKRLNKYVGNSFDLDSKPTIELLERGPVRAKIGVTRTILNSTYAQEITIYSKIRRIDFNLRVRWNEIHRALKVAFPISMSNPTLTSETQYGTIIRPANGKEQPIQQWVDLSEPDGSYGVSLLNDSRYGCDVRNNRIVRLTILRSPTEPAYNTDEGIHETKYALYPHDGDWMKSDVMHRGYEFNNPLMPMIEESHKGAFPKTRSFLQITPKSLIVTALKKAENSEDLILRLYETAGQKTAAEIVLNLGKLLKAACKTNLLEDEMLGEVEVGNSKLSFTVDPYEIATIKVSLQ